MPSRNRALNLEFWPLHAWGCVEDPVLPCWTEANHCHQAALASIARGNSWHPTVACVAKPDWIQVVKKFHEPLNTVL
jgi:hypothetical protein